MNWIPHADVYEDASAGAGAIRAFGQVVSIFIEACGMVISMASETMISGLKALSDPTRLHIVEFLSTCCCGRASVREDGGVESPTAGEVCCHITGAEKITSTVSHHLHELEAAGLVNLEKRGKATLCTLRPEGLTELATYLTRLAAGNEQGSCC